MFEAGRVAVGPARIVIRADTAMVLLSPRTWTAGDERFFQFFYCVGEEAERAAGRPGAVRLQDGERWSITLGSETEA